MIAQSLNTNQFWHHNNAIETPLIPVVAKELASNACFFQSPQLVQHMYYITPTTDARSAAAAAVARR
jgi:hypothetical protein